MTVHRIRECFSCCFHDSSGLIVCAIHPDGPGGDLCSDYVAIAEVAEQGLWVPEDWTFIGRELVRSAAGDLVQLDDSHPINTGDCPQCGYRFEQEPEVHWDCLSCRWKDDSV